MIDLIQKIISYNVLNFVAFLGKKNYNYYNKKTPNADIISEKRLLKAIKKNKNTAIGKKYCFSEIKTIKDFQRKIPYTTYNDYIEYIEKTANTGEQKLITSDKICFFAATSGTTISGLSVTFKKPGLTAVYPFKIQNKGTINAKIDSVAISDLTCKDASNATVACPVTAEFACKATSDASTYTTLVNGSNTGMRNLAGASSVGGSNGEYSDCKLTITYPEAQPESGETYTGNVNQGEINISNISATWVYSQN